MKFVFLVVIVHSHFSTSLNYSRFGISILQNSLFQSSILLHFLRFYLNQNNFVRPLLLLRFTSPPEIFLRQVLMPFSLNEFSDPVRP